MTNSEFREYLRTCIASPEEYHGEETLRKMTSEAKDKIKRIEEDPNSIVKSRSTSYSYWNRLTEEAKEKIRAIEKAEDSYYPIPDELKNYVEEEREGGEGQGEHYHIVISFPDADKHIYASAFYTSHDGVSDWDNEWTIVEPYEKTIRDWRNVE